MRAKSGVHDVSMYGTLLRERARTSNCSIRVFRRLLACTLHKCFRIARRAKECSATSLSVRTVLPAIEECDLWAGSSSAPIGSQPTNTHNTQAIFVQTRRPMVVARRFVYGSARRSGSSRVRHRRSFGSRIRSPSGHRQEGGQRAPRESQAAGAAFAIGTMTLASPQRRPRSPPAKGR